MFKIKCLFQSYFNYLSFADLCSQQALACHGELNLVPFPVHNFIKTAVV